jgi:hypothetical protein
LYFRASKRSGTPDGVCAIRTHEKSKISAGFLIHSPEY